jgi:hypothetical protein
MYQINSYALDLLAYFNSDGHIMSLGIASQWFIMQSTQSAIYSCQGGLGRHALIVHLQLIDCGFDGWILLLQICFE